MGGNVNQSTRRGIGPTGAERGSDTGTKATDTGGVGAEDAVGRDPEAEGAGGGGGIPHHPRHPHWNREG